MLLRRYGNQNAYIEIIISLYFWLDHTYHGNHVLKVEINFYD